MLYEKAYAEWTRYKINKYTHTHTQGSKLYQEMAVRI